MQSKILVVEEDDAVREICRKLLESVGWVVLTANNGGDGLKIAVENRPIIVIADLDMIEMDGVELTRQLNKNKATESTPVIIMSGWHEGVDSPRFAGLRLSAVISKPFNRDELLRAIRETLSRPNPVT